MLLSSTRIHAIQTKMMLKGYDALCIARSVNLRYLTGFDTSDGLLLITTKGVYFFLDGRYDGLGRRCFIDGPVVRLDKEYQSVIKILKQLKIKRLGYDTKSREVIAVLKKYKRNTRFSPIHHFVEELRMIKSKHEIVKIKDACHRADMIFSELKNYIEGHTTEWDVQKFIRQTALQYDVFSLSFDPIVAFGKNSSFPHYMHTNKQRYSAQCSMILLDMGVDVEGYKSDMTRMLFVGKLSRIVRQQYEKLLRIQENVIATIRPGKRIADTVLFYQNEMKKAGFNRFIRHALGHGVGFQIHERPSLTTTSYDIWKTGMVVAIEPAIYFTGKYGMRIEDVILVGKRKPIYLTKSNKSIHSNTLLFSKASY
jgi:Xaa-Pro aminopeptidase